MQTSERAQAVAAARAIAASYGLVVEGTRTLHDSNKITLRLLPCDVVARVAPAPSPVAAYELDLAQRLARVGCPVAVVEPRMAPVAYEHDGFVVTFWTHYESLAPASDSPADYAAALHRLHACLREVDVPAPHVTDRVDAALQLVVDRDLTPDLADGDRTLLDRVLRTLRPRVGASGAAQQLLHGEPHPGNVLATTGGLLFVDLETVCRGPIEFDVAHAPDEIADHYPHVDHDLLHDCRLLMLAMITTWRWDRFDRLPDGRARGLEWLNQLRAAF